MREVTARRQADREAERSREALVEERGRMVALLQQTTLQRRKFFAALSAQLRSPLLCMAGLVEELLDTDAAPSTEERVAHLNAFVTAGTHLVFTIDDMLALYPALPSRPSSLHVSLLSLPPSLHRHP